MPVVFSRVLLLVPTINTRSCLTRQPPKIGGHLCIPVASTRRSSTFLNRYGPDFDPPNKMLLFGLLVGDNEGCPWQQNKARFVVLQGSLHAHLRLCDFKLVTFPSCSCAFHMPNTNCVALNRSPFLLAHFLATYQTPAGSVELFSRGTVELSRGATPLPSELSERHCGDRGLR